MPDIRNSTFLSADLLFQVSTMSIPNKLPDAFEQAKKLEEAITGPTKRIEAAVTAPIRRIEEAFNGPARKLKMLAAGGIFQGSGSAGLTKINQINEAIAPCELIEPEPGFEIAISVPMDLEPQRPEAVDRSLKTQEEIEYHKALAQRKPEGRVTKKPIEERLESIESLLEKQAGKTDELVGLMTTSVIYLHFDWRDGYFKIGYSLNYEKPASGKKGKGRKETHESAGLEYIAHAPALQTKETMLKNLMKEAHKQRDDDLFKPKRKSAWEEFKPSKEFIGILRAVDWPGSDQDLERFLKDHRQGEFNFSAA